jgi:hypothetical protein
MKVKLTVLVNKSRNEDVVRVADLEDIWVEVLFC